MATLEAETDFLRSLGHRYVSVKTTSTHGLVSYNLIKCRNIVGFEGMALQRGQCYLVLEYCEHGSLFSLLRDKVKYPALSRQAQTSFMLDMASGLSYLHERGRVHGDMKSLNVLVKGYKHKICKLTDFDSSMHTQHLDDDHKCGRGGQTVSWMAIELFHGSGISAEADVWALGVIFWEVATRKQPFSDNPNPRREILAHRMPALDESWPVPWCSLMSKSWMVEPGQRPSAWEVAAQLHSAIIPGSLAEPEDSQPLLEQEQLQYVPRTTTM
jgi:serine/threonine protein kinase